MSTPVFAFGKVVGELNFATGPTAKNLIFYAKLADPLKS